MLTCEPALPSVTMIGDNGWYPVWAGGVPKKNQSRRVPYKGSKVGYVNKRGVKIPIQLSRYLDGVMEFGTPCAVEDRAWKSSSVQKIALRPGESKDSTIPEFGFTKTCDTIGKPLKLVVATPLEQIARSCRRVMSRSMIWQDIPNSYGAVHPKYQTAEKRWIGEQVMCSQLRQSALWNLSQGAKNPH